MKVEMAVFGSASLINLMVSVDVKPHERRSALLVYISKTRLFYRWSLIRFLACEDIKQNVGNVTGTPGLRGRPLIDFLHVVGYSRIALRPQKP